MSCYVKKSYCSVNRNTDVMGLMDEFISSQCLADKHEGMSRFSGHTKGTMESYFAELSTTINYLNQVKLIFLLHY